MFGKKRKVCSCKPKRQLDLLDSIESFKGFEDEDISYAGRCFEENAGSDISMLWQRMFTQLIKWHYYELAHLPEEKRTVTMQAELGGRIKMLEDIIGIPAIYIEKMNEIREEKEKNAE